ncbi:hypothetical protein QQY24_14590 [Streptomyces sp. TG1A-8]|uniref:hypothetical protein n=1 Tax=Streptomyces sp. TG1A-8 TaxID=3051385 RepID=UPI00265C8941|nr:hypothetical protein [Streptomyces sp. TG1A-8]MDO0926579.1 hypothetical protein [Streptomyces sp. TG1A-8]
MAETTHTQTTGPGAAGRPRSPAFRLAADALRGLRQDLFHDAFAHRPLPRAAADGPLGRRLPDRARQYAGRAPHAAVAAAGGAAALVALADGHTGPSALLCAPLALGPVLLTLVRPAGVFCCRSWRPRSPRSPAPAATPGPGRRAASRRT